MSVLDAKQALANCDPLNRPLCNELVVISQTPGRIRKNAISSCASLELHRDRVSRISSLIGSRGIPNLSYRKCGQL